ETQAGGGVSLFVATGLAGVSSPGTPLSARHTGGRPAIGKTHDGRTAAAGVRQLRAGAASHPVGRGGGSEPAHHASAGYIDAAGLCHAPPTARPEFARRTCQRHRLTAAGGRRPASPAPGVAKYR